MVTHLLGDHHHNCNAMATQVQSTMMVPQKHTKNVHVAHSGPQVIGCGLPRTGTTSTGKALAILLNGPVSDTTSDTFLHGSRSQINDLYTLSSSSLAPGSPDLLALIHKIFTEDKPYVASVDNPMPLFLEEIQELYPDCKFLCTTRERESWVESFVGIWLVLRTLRPWRKMWWRMDLFLGFVDRYTSPRVIHNYGSPPVKGKTLLDIEGEDRELLARWMWERHHEYVRRVVPTERLCMYDVREGWGPLCSFLGVEVPEVDFPHEFSGGSVKQWAGEMLGMLKARALGVALLSSVAVGVLGWYLWKG